MLFRGTRVQRGSVSSLAEIADFLGRSPHRALSTVAVSEYQLRATHE